MSCGVFPDACKVAKLKPIYKKKKKNPSNCRPISLLPIISKVIEKIVHDQTSKFVSENNILYNLGLIKAVFDIDIPILGTLIWACLNLVLRKIETTIKRVSSFLIKSVT